MNESEKNEEKPLFILRFFAFLLDVFVVVVITSIISLPFANNGKNEKLQEQSLKIIENFQNKEITSQEYIEQYTDVYYKMERSNGITSIITIFVGVLYYVVFQLYNGGQTLGKRLARIRVVSIDGDLFMNQIIYRSLLANFILVNLITFCLMIFSPKFIFLCGATVTECLQYILMVVSAIMIMNSKDGSAIHDKLAHTKVVKV